MKKTIWIAALTVIGLAAFGMVSFARAQTPAPSTPNTPSNPGMFGRKGSMPWGRMHGGMWGQGVTGEYGPMHDYMQAALAEGLGVSVEDLKTVQADGKTMWQFASEKGLSLEEFQQIMQTARQKAIEKMVEDGLLTREQADWMLNRMQNMWEGGFRGRGGCSGMGGRYGGPNNRGVPPATNPGGPNF